MSMRKDKDFLSKLFHITLPITFQNFMLAAVAAADAVMLGQIHQNSMSAVSIATQVQFIQNMIIFSIISVESILGAQYWGKGDKDSVNKIFCIGLKWSAAVSLLFFLACEFCPRLLMRIYTNSEDLIPYGIEYLRIAGFSYLLSGISQSYLCIMKISDHPERTAFISSCTVVINIILNAVFIFGFFGLPQMNVKGAALATVISRVIEFTWCIIISYKKNYVHPKIRFLFSFHKLLELDFIKTLFPLVGAALFWGIGFSAYTSFMGHLGTDAAAANSITAVLRDLLCCVCNGLCTAAGIIVGNELGKGDLEKGKIYGNRMLVLASISGLLVVALCFIITPFSIHFGKLSETADKYLIQMMLVMSVYMFGRYFNTIVINGVFAAGGDTMFDMYSLAITMWGIAIPLAALGTYFFHWPIFLVYACTCLDEVGKIPWVIFHFKKYKWVKDLTR